MPEPVDPVETDVDTDTETAADVRTSTATESADDGFKPITSQEEFDSRLKNRLERAERSTEKKFNAQIKELTDKIAGFENEKLSDAEKRDKRLAELEKALQERDEKLTKLERAKIVSELAHDAKLPKKLWDRVKGDTEDEIAADIQELLEAYPTPESKDDKGAKKPPSQGATVKVQPTGSDGEIEESADAILESISPRYRG